MVEKLKSRKFWLALLGALIPALAHYLDGSVSLEQAMQAASAVVVAYLFSQGYADGKALEGTVPAGRSAIASLTPYATASLRSLDEITPPDTGSGPGGPS